MSGWTRLDYLLLGLVLLSTLLSFFQGFTRELISLGAAVWGVLSACWFYDRVAPWFVPYVKTPEIASLAAFVSIVLAFLVAGWVISATTVRLLKKAGLGWFDRLMGAGFGLVRGVLIGLALVMALLVFSPGTKAVEGSRLAPYLVLGARALAAAAPADVKARFSAGLERAQKIWNQRVPL